MQPPPPFMVSEIFRELIPPMPKNKRKRDMPYGPVASTSSTPLGTRGISTYSTPIYDGLPTVAANPSIPPPLHSVPPRPSTSSTQIEPQISTTDNAMDISTAEAASTSISPNAAGLGHCLPPSPSKVIDLTHSSPDIPVQPLPVVANDALPTASQNNSSLSANTNPSGELPSSESEVSAMFDSVGSALSSLSSAPSEDMMQSAETFIQNAIRGNQSSDGAASSSTSLELKKKQLEESIRLMRERLNRKKEMAAVDTGAKKVLSPGNWSIDVSNAGAANGTGPSNNDKEEEEGFPPLPASPARPALLAAQISRMTILIQKVKSATTPDEKNRYSKLVRKCEDEYNARVSALPPISSCSTASTSVIPRTTWPFRMETEIWISDSEEE